MAQTKVLGFPPERSNSDLGFHLYHGLQGQVSLLRHHSFRKMYRRKNLDNSFRISAANPTVTLDFILPMNFKVNSF